MGRSKMILVVDDEPVIAETLVTILNEFQDEFLAVASTDILDAFAIARDMKPNLVLLDIAMPGTRGLEHAIEIRDNLRCPVLLITGHIRPNSLLNDLGPGVQPFDYIQKPIHPVELIDRIRAMTNHRSVA